MLPAKDHQQSIRAERGAWDFGEHLHESTDSFFRAVAKDLGGDSADICQSIVNTLRTKYLRTRLKHMLTLTRAQFTKILLDSGAPPDSEWLMTIEEMLGARFAVPSESGIAHTNTVPDSAKLMRSASGSMVPIGESNTMSHRRTSVWGGVDDTQVSLGKELDRRGELETLVLPEELFMSCLKTTANPQVSQSLFSGLSYAMCP